jgi:hypothetical protein
MNSKLTWALWLVVAGLTAGTTAAGIVLSPSDQRSAFAIGILSFWVSTSSLLIAGLQIRRVATATEAAKTAVDVALASLGRRTVAIEVAHVTEKLAHVRELQDNQDWVRAQDRYPDIRRMLAGIATGHPDLHADERTEIEAAIQLLSVIETNISTARANKTTPNLSDAEKRVLFDVEILLQRLETRLKTEGLG